MPRTRKRSIPLMHRWSRPIMAGIASFGAVVTAYLTYTKFTGDGAACPTKGCDVVLSSPYATVFGLPLALFGFLAYASMALLAIAPLVINSSKREKLRDALENWTGLLLFMGATAMLVFSSYLMYLLAFEIKTVCVYCVASAIFSATLFILAIVGREWRDVGQLLFSGVIVAMVVLVGTLGVYANVNQPVTQQLAPGELPVTTASGESEIALAKHLSQIGAKFYGAFWCPHCHDQKQLFGKEAVQFVPYVECSTPDRRDQTPACKEQKIESYPTWIVNGQTLRGTQTLEQLAQVSGYQGSRSFKNTLTEF
jgi:uncharacterized membrane protein/glutaredoxin